VDRVRTLKLTLAYDGSRFVGWQRQATGDSVQGLLERALTAIEGAPVAVHGAGRTDAGVHALGQVASAQLAASHDTGTLLRALNAQLPYDVRVLTVEDAAPDFHARFSARRKTYRYLLRNAPFAHAFERAFVWHVAETLRVEPMQTAAALLRGTHDFAAFRSAGSDVSTTIRTIGRSAMFEAEGWPLLGGAAAGRLIVFEVEGDGFLRHMVRALVGTLVEVGRGSRPPESMAALLRAGTRGEAGPTAPAHGLYLVAVDYD